MTTLTKSANQHLHRPIDGPIYAWLCHSLLCGLWRVSKWWSKTKYNKQQQLRRRRRRKRQLAKTTVKTFTKKKKRRKTHTHSEHLKRCAIVWILRDHFVGVHTNWLYSVTKWLSSDQKRYNGRWFTHSFMNFDYWNSTATHFSVQKFPIGISWLRAEKRQLHSFISFSLSFSLSISICSWR